ncbi:hypothetical protein MLD38_024657 [Melastoma candidum]|uniref:Uncharacterized protein n=1 Tax=Melastoma candidum TaxID=119954 RepID=A0ACB9NSX5_9MYRT|nr:hypothetical protein MLD38_024657 [Melastoma candidum]
MAEARGEKVSSLAEQYLLPPEEEKPAVEQAGKVEVAEPVKAVAEEVIEKAKEASDALDEVASSAVEAVSDAVASNDSTEQTEQVDSVLASDESEGTNEEENSSSEDAAESTPEIKLETAPADFRFPTTNQTRHCFTRYIEYHRCVAAKGEDAQECQKFAKYYRALCPGEWVDRWNEQRENGTFPGPL